MSGGHRVVSPGGARLAIPAAVLAAVLVVVCIAYLDRPAALWAHELEPGLVGFCKQLTKLGGSGPWLAATALLAPLLHWRLGRPRAARRALFVFAAIAVSGLAVDLLKVLFGRWRPKALLEQAHYGFEFLRVGYLHNSFPSGHATTAGALAVALTLLFPRWRVLWFGAFAVVAASRVIVGAHYPGDVVAGFWFGAVVTLALAGSRWFRVALAGAGGPAHAGAPTHAPPCGTGRAGV